MDINNQKKNDSVSGLLSLEASIVLTLFIFMMLFLYSFFVIFEARNNIGHALLSAADSLSLDAFANEAADDGSIQSILYSVYGSASSGNGVYTQTDKWYDDAEKVKNEAKARFVAYLSNGSEDKANEILTKLHVVNGLDGLDFSGCKVEKEDIYLEVKYQLEYEFKVFNLAKLSFSQKCCSKLWK